MTETKPRPAMTRLRYWLTEPELGQFPGFLFSDMLRYECPRLAKKLYLRICDHDTVVQAVESLSDDEISTLAEIAERVVQDV